MQQHVKTFQWVLHLAVSINPKCTLARRYAAGITKESMERAQLHYDTAMRHGSSIQFSYFSSLQSRWKATEYLRYSRRVRPIKSRNAPSRQSVLFLKAVKSQKSLAPCFGLNATKQRPEAQFNLVHAKIPGPSRFGRYEAQFFDQALHACKSGECTKTQHVKSQQIFLQPQLLASREARVQVVVPRCQSFKILQGHEGHTLRFVFIFPKSISDAWVLVKVPSPWGERREGGRTGNGGK